MFHKKTSPVIFQCPSMSELVLNLMQRLKRLMLSVSVHLFKKYFRGKYHLSFFNVRVGSEPDAKVEEVYVNASIHIYKTWFQGKYHQPFFNARVGSGPDAKAA